MKFISFKNGKLAFVGDGINDAPASSVAQMSGLLTGIDIAIPVSRFGVDN